MGTPALTTRGMKEDAIRKIAGWIVQVLANPDDEEQANRVRAEIREFVQDYPVPADTTPVRA